MVTYLDRVTTKVEGTDITDRKVTLFKVSGGLKSSSTNLQRARLSSEVDSLRSTSVRAGYTICATIVLSVPN